MHRPLRNWMLPALALAALGPGCRKQAADGPRDAPGTILLTQPDGAPLVGPVITNPAPPVPGTGELRRCRVALRRPDWGPGGGLGSMQFKLRTFRGRGTRAEVAKAAREWICREDGIPPERCTDDLFLPEYEWCDGDPAPERKPLSPELQQMADRIRAGAETGQPVQLGTPPSPDAAPAPPPPVPPPPAADAGPVIF